MRRVSLDFVPRDTPTANWAVLRDVCGEDEEAVDAADTARAIDLLDRCCVAAPGAAIGPGEACSLAASDRDRLLAAVFEAEFGTRIDCTLRCAGCGEPFDIGFELPEFIASLGPCEAAADGMLRLADGRRVRVPRGADELAVQGLLEDAAAAQLLSICLPDGAPRAGDQAAVEALLERAAPVIDADLDAVCPECGGSVAVHFDLQHYLLTAIAQEAPARVAEIHLLARTYGWSLGEILGLRRRRRRAFVTVIERDRGAQPFEM